MGDKKQTKRIYLEKDLWYFITLGPYLQLSTPERAWKLLQRKAPLLVEFRADLPQFPQTQNEQLEFWYYTWRSIGMLDVDSLQGMLTRCGWRGVVWGGWLALMHPRPEFAPILAAVPEHTYENEWAARCALADIEERPLEGKYEQLRRMTRMCRDYLAMAPIVPMPLRLQPSEEELEHIERDRIRVREAYHRRGAEAAREIIRNSPLAELIMSYPEWFRKRQGLPMRRDYVNGLLHFNK